MATKTTSQKTTERRSETRAKSTKVSVLTSAFLAEGSIRHPSEQSLPDILNNGLSVSTTRNTKQAVPLSEARVLLPSGEEEHKRSMRVKRSEVILVAETGKAPLPTPAMSTTAPKKRRNQHMALVKVNVSNYTVTGKIAGAVHQRWTEKPDDIDSFVPLTEAEISPKLSNGGWLFHAVIVNKAHVTSLAKCKIAPPEVEMTLVRITRYAEKMEASFPSDLADLESITPDAQVQEA